MARILLLMCLVELFYFTQCAKKLIVPVEFPSKEERNEKSAGRELSINGNEVSTVLSFHHGDHEIHSLGQSCRNI